MEKSPFKTLPIELRLQIYELALHQPKKITLVKVRRKTKGGKRPIRAIDAERGPRPRAGNGRQVIHPDYSYYTALLALPSTCRQMRNESMPVFMKVNHFEVYPDAIPLFGSLRRWKTRTANVEITIEDFDLGKGGKITLAKRMVDVKKLCTKYGVRGSIMLHFTLKDKTPPAQSLWNGSLVLQFASDDQDAMQKVVDRKIRDATSVVVRWQREAPQYSWDAYFKKVSRMQKRMTWLLKELERDSGWSWT